MTHQDMRFGVIRHRVELSGVEYVLDGRVCPACHTATEIKEEDPTRRYCTHKQCNALIKE